MIGYKSITKWADSMFGGYNRLIQDHPTIIFPYQDILIETSNELNRDLGFYNSEVLVKMYIYQISKTDIDSFQLVLQQALSTLTEDTLVVKKQYDYSKQDLVEKYYVRISMKKFLEISLSEDFTEYFELYAHFSKGLETSTLLYQIPQNQDSDNKGNSDDSGEEENDSDDKEESEGDNEEDNEGEGSENSSEDKEGEGETGKLSKKISEISKNAKELSEDLIDNTKKIKTFSYNSDKLSKFDQKAKLVPLPKTSKKGLSKSSAKYGSYIEKLLDIDFESKDDVIKSLKSGKLDLNKICEVPAGNTNVYHRVEEDQDTQTFQVVILGDLSGSMGVGYDKSRLENQKTVIDSLYYALKDKLKGRLSIYGHTGDYSPELYCFMDKFTPDYETNHSSYYSISTIQNYDGPIIEFLHETVRKNTDEKILLIVLSDGEPAGVNYGGEEDCKDLKKIIEKLNRDNFITCCIGIDSPGVEHLYKHGISVDFSKSDNIFMKDIATFINKVVNLELK